MDIADINVKVIIAFGITMIVCLLTYIAFFKESVDKSSHTRKK